MSTITWHDPLNGGRITSGALHANLRDSSGNELVLPLTNPTGQTGTIAQASGSAITIGDLTPYGFAYTDVTLTKTNANATAPYTWAVDHGIFVLTFTAHASDSFAITASDANGNALKAAPLYVDAADGVIKNAALTGATAYSIQFWRP